MATAARLNDLDFSTVASLVDAINEDPQNAATVWQADVRWRGGFRSEASIRGFEPVPSDEPEGLAGSNTAPNPVEQVAAALGNCLAVGYVAQLTARGIAVNDLEIGVTGELDLRPFLGLASGHAGYSRLDVSVRIDADTDAETLQLVHEQVVATSPVGHTLANPVTVDVRLVAYAPTIRPMPRITLLQGDITEQTVDAIVNAANAQLAGGGGVDGAIHRAGGPSIMEECRRLAGCPTGDARATGAGDLDARWVVHAVGPVWHGGDRGEDALLASAHRRALEVAAELGARSVAIPAISTGIYGFPVERAAPIAVREAAAAPAPIEEVRFVLFSDRDLDVYRRAAGQ